MFLVIALIVLIVSCIFYILFVRLWNIITIIILNYFSGSLLISSLFIWSCVFLPCFFICPIFLCLFCFFFFFFSNVLHLKSPFPDFRDVSLLPFGFCSQWERLFQWFVLISYWGNLSLHCSGGSELFYCFYFFPDGKGCVRQYNLECLWESCGWYCFCAFVLPLDWVRDPAEYAVGSPVIPDSVYSSRPSWILSVINFLNFHGCVCVQVGVL